MATYWENSCSFGLRYVSWYKYLIVSLVFSHLGFWSGNLFLIAPFPDLCLLVPLYHLAGILDSSIHCTVITADQPLYSRGKELVWANKENYGNIFSEWAVYMFSSVS